VFYYSGRILWLLICWVELAVFTVALYLLSFLPHTLIKSAYFRLFSIWCRFFVRALGVDLRLHQKNIKPIPKQFILIANHPSAFEDVGIPALFKVYPVGKIEIRDWWWVGRINQAAGTLFVKRESRESRNDAAGQIAQTLSEGNSVAIFPEGGCKGRRIYKDFRHGAFDISLRTGVPILPVFIHYEAQQDFEWQPPHTLIDMMWHFMTTQNNRANFYVYDAIDPQQFPDKKTYNEHVHNLYLQWQAKYLE